MAKEEKPLVEIVARLTLVVEFDVLPDTNDIEELVDQARGNGAIAKADFEHLKLVTKSFK